MAFDMITKRRLFDSLWERARKGQPAPSLRLIAKEQRLADEAAAERLLRDMAADGAISIVGEVTAYPWLTLRRNSYTGDFVSAPVWLEREKVEAAKIGPVEIVETGGCAPPVFVPLKPGPKPKPDAEVRSKQISCFVTPAVHAVLDGEADRLGIATGRHASNVLIDACTGADTRRKHKISAAVQRACAEDGRPLPEFVTALIEIGLEEWRRFRSMAEAAE